MRIRLASFRMWCVVVLLTTVAGFSPADPPAPTSARAVPTTDSNLMGKLETQLFKPSLSDDEMRSALQSPIDTPRLSEMAKGAKKVCILIDDIFTTGATAKSCCQALKKQGAGEIIVLTLSKTL